MDAARRMEIEIRREQVAALLLSRVPYRQMAELLQVSKSQICDDVAVVRKQWRERAAEKVEQYVVEQMSEIDGMLRAWMPVAMNPGSPDAADGGAQVLAAARAAKVVMGAWERRSKLLGMDAPVRAELTGEGGGPIQFEGIEQARAAANVAVSQFVLRRRQQLEADSDDGIVDAELVDDADG